jgi:hypothetical protein
MPLVRRACFSRVTLLISFLLVGVPAYAGHGSAALLPRQLGSGASIHLLPDLAATPPQTGPSAPWRIVGEVAGGLAGEVVEVLPAGCAGFLLGEALAWTRDCDSLSDFNRRAECVESIKSQAHTQGLWIGASLGVGLGSGLGVALAGWALHGQGNAWFALALGLAGGSLGLLMPQPAGLLASAGFAVLGATLAYELSSSQWRGPTSAVSAMPRLSIIPTLAARPGGGTVAVVGRF